MCSTANILNRMSKTMYRCRPYFLSIYLYGGLARLVYLSTKCTEMYVQEIDVYMSKYVNVKVRTVSVMSVYHLPVYCRGKRG